MAEIKEYWDKKFSEKSKIWGDKPSETAVKLVKFFPESDFQDKYILDLACGYGRDAFYFAQKKFCVKGIDISDVAINIAKETPAANVEFIVGDIFHLPYVTESIDIVFGNFILHLFSYHSRREILDECYRVLNPGGFAVFSVASVEDADFGVGQEVEENCFINSRGVTKYYYSKEAVHREFSRFHVVEIDDIEEYHNHDTPHTHKSYLIIVRKEGVEHVER